MPSTLASAAERSDPERGIYETMLIAGGRVHGLEAHLRRMERSAAEVYGMELPERPRAQIIEMLTTATGVPGEQRARIEATPHGSRLEMTVTVTDIPSRQPVTLTPIIVPGGLGAHKWQDRRLVERHGADPVPLLVDEDATVLEAAWANVWLLDGDALVTPPTDGRILPGITRARLLRLAPELGLRAAERPISLDEARAADTLFLTASVRLAVAASFSPHPRDPPEVDRIRVALANS